MKFPDVSILFKNKYYHLDNNSKIIKNVSSLSNISEENTTLNNSETDLSYETVSEDLLSWTNYFAEYYEDSSDDSDDNDEFTLNSIETISENVNAAIQLEDQVYQNNVLTLHEIENSTAMEPSSSNNDLYIAGCINMFLNED